MSELSRDGRVVLEAGLRLDGPSGERRARVKARVMLAAGLAAASLGGATSAAAEAASTAAGAAALSAKGLTLGSLLVWFGVAAAAGVGATGAVVATRHVTSVRTETPASAVAALPSPKLASTPGPNGPAVTPVATASVEAASEAPATAASSDASRRAPPGVNPPGAPAAMSATAVSAPPVADAPPSASASFDANTTTTLREEAALLQHAERALAASDPNAALAWLGEHERRFPSGALREERQAAKVLAFCALGRVAEARGLARAFLSASPGSVLVPRLERSCVGTSLKGR